MALALERANLALQERQNSYSTPRGSPRDNSSQSSPAAGAPPPLSPTPGGEPACPSPHETIGTFTCAHGGQTANSSVTG